ncbi:hypothetical protein L210DRAFT_982394 [Boletus edulis BED1]|uniref:Uncharacterized protein n=1 Tax=Boletus edulis BED1 TaxID=1328754 RepID=A0AAD4GD92_BOLED|nr:hypothetical protein L210DRAFT_982394 [Boletus edulis BED1]
MASNSVLDFTFTDTSLVGSYIVIAGLSLALLQEKGKKLFLTYTIVQLVFTTLYFAIPRYTIPAQSLAIFNIVGPHSPAALSPWLNITVNVAFVLNTWASDGFLLHRCYVACVRLPQVYCGEKPGNKYALAYPTVFYLGTLGSSVAWLVVSSTPGAVYSTHTVQVANLCYWSFSTAMTICASCLICAQFWKYQREIMQGIKYKHRTVLRVYLEMTLESALLYTVFLLVTLVLTVLESPLKNVFCPVLGMAQVGVVYHFIHLRFPHWQREVLRRSTSNFSWQSIAPALIIYRVARGISPDSDERYTGVIGNLRFSARASYPLQPVTQSDHQNSFDGSGPSPGEVVMAERDEPESAVHIA